MPNTFNGQHDRDRWPSPISMCTYRVSSMFGSGDGYSISCVALFWQYYQRDEVGISGNIRSAIRSSDDDWAKYRIQTHEQGWNYRSEGNGLQIIYIRSACDLSTFRPQLERHRDGPLIPGSKIPACPRRLVFLERLFALRVA